MTATVERVVGSSATTPPTSRQALKARAPVVDDVVFLTSDAIDGDRQGLFRCRAGSSPVSDPLEGLYITSNTAGFFWERQWDGVYGRPEWFGAQVNVKAADCQPAISNCHRLCPVTQLSEATYYTYDTVKADEENHGFSGVASSTLGSGSTICLTGANVVAATVFEIGSGNSSSHVGWQSHNDFNVARDCTGQAQPRESPTGDPIDGTKGIVVYGANNTVINRVRSFDSPIGMHVLDTVACDISRVDCACANIPAGMHIVFHLIGKYGASGGYIGSNASLYCERLTGFDKNSPASSIFIKLFGKPGDTWLYRPETGGVDFGIIIEGLDQNGNIMSGAGNQDIKIRSPILDQVSNTGILISGMNSSAAVGVSDAYVYANGAATCLTVRDIEGGSVSITGDNQLLGDGNSTGVYVANTRGVNIGEETLLRDHLKPLVVEFVSASSFAPKVWAPNNGASRAVDLRGTVRCSIAPAVYGSANKIGTGIWMEADCVLNGIDGSRVDPGCFTVVDAAYKVRFINVDARSSGPFSSNGNVLIGATG